MLTKHVPTPDTDHFNNLRELTNIQKRVIPTNLNSRSKFRIAFRFDVNKVVRPWDVFPEWFGQVAVYWDDWLVVAADLIGGGRSTVGDVLPGVYFIVVGCGGWDHDQRL